VGLPLRRGCSGRHELLDDAPGRERPHDPEHRPELPCEQLGRLADPASLAGSLPDPTTGAWNAADADSGGWQQWSINLNAYAGQQVDIRISYASDWATQGLGVFVDDVTLPDGSSTSFEGGDTGGWVASGPPPGSAPNVNNWVLTTAAGFPEGATITTEDTLLLGFGLEAVTGADTRAAVMGRAMDYLLDD
jgi:hypothetical protein